MKQADNNSAKPSRAGCIWVTNFQTQPFFQPLPFFSTRPKHQKVSYFLDVILFNARGRSCCGVSRPAKHVQIGPFLTSKSRDILNRDK